MMCKQIKEEKGQVYFKTCPFSLSNYVLNQIVFVPPHSVPQVVRIFNDVNLYELFLTKYTSHIVLRYAIYG